MTTSRPEPARRPVPGDDPELRLSVWATAQRDARTQRRGRYLPESVAHPAKMLPAIAATAIARYTRPGDLVADPMCGIGTTLIEAIHLGRNAIGVEYEPRWVAFAADGIALAKNQGAVGTARIIQGDARLLPGLAPAEVRSRVALVVTSPPYGPSIHGHVRARPGGVAKYNNRYSRDPVNLAHHGLDDLVDGITQILAGCAVLLRPGGIAVITARPWRHRGELVDFPGAVVEAGRTAGLVPIERCVALLAGIRGGQLIARPSFFQLDNVRKARARGEPWHLIVHEDVLVFRAPGFPGGSRELKGPQRGPACTPRALPLCGHDEPGTRQRERPAALHAAGSAACAPVTGALTLPSCRCWAASWPGAPKPTGTAARSWLPTSKECPISATSPPWTGRTCPLSTSSPPAGRARTSRWQARAPESRREPAVACGSTSPPASARCGPVPCSLRTWPHCAPGAWPASWQTLPPWGMTRNGRPYALATWAPRTLVPASSSWPPSLDPSRSWRLVPTPQARDHHGAQLPELRRAAGHQVNLNDVALALAVNWAQDGWGRYEPPVRRWEAISGTAAPFPALRGPGGRFRLSEAFTEWVMGVTGWVIGVPGLPYYAQIRALGNGVVPRQAAAALRLLTEVAAALGVPQSPGLTCPRELSLDAGRPGRKASRARAPATPGVRARPAPTAAARAPRPPAEAGPRAASAAANADAPGNDRRAA